MRTYTLLLSIAAHLAIVGALFVVPIVATNVLPKPKRAIEFVIVNPPVPQPTKPTIPERPRDAPAPDPVPLMEPATIEPERAHPAPAQPVPEVDGAPGGVADLVALGSTGLPQVAPPPPPPPAPPRTPIRVGTGLRAPQRIHYEAPQYPAIARESRVDGLVILEAVIGEDGAVRDVRVLKSIRLLDQAAVDAVRRWRFTPTLLNGQPVPIVMTVTVTFSLN